MFKNNWESEVKRINYIIIKKDVHVINVVTILKNIIKPNTFYQKKEIRKNPFLKYNHIF